ncbi:MAG: hypothetical protein ACPGYV_03065 [Phycisphaeraceae bacterium]
MPGLTLQLDRDDARYVPGEPIGGAVSWDLGEDPRRVTVRLVWETSGKGTADSGVVDEIAYDAAGLREAYDFVFDGVDGPYSFSGRLMTIAWRVEAVAERGDGYAERLLTLSPTGEEVRP